MDLHGVLKFAMASSRASSLFDIVVPPRFLHRVMGCRICHESIVQLQFLVGVDCVVGCYLFHQRGFDWEGEVIGENGELFYVCTNCHYKFSHRIDHNQVYVPFGNLTMLEEMQHSYDRDLCCANCKFQIAKLNSLVGFETDECLFKIERNGFDWDACLEVGDGLCVFVCPQCQMRFDEYSDEIAVYVPLNKLKFSEE